MTDSDRQATGWDDDRLAAAFQARAAANATPHDLADVTIEAARRRPEAGPRGSRLAWLGGLAAAASVAVIVVVLAAQAEISPAADGPTAFGLPTVTVAQAAAIRDGGVDGQEFAVAGIYKSGGIMFCPAPRFEKNPTLLWCEDSHNSLVDGPEPNMTGSQPLKPTIRPGLSLVSTDGLPIDPASAVAVVMIGHFDDRRSSFCAEEVRSTCADTFLVDRIQQVGDAIIPTVTIAERDPILDEPTVDAAVQAVDPRLEILSRRVVDSDHLVDTEPLLATARFSHFTAFEEPLVWVVAAIVPSANGAPVEARTFVVPDGLSIVHVAEMTPTDVVSIILTASAEPSLVVTPAPTPSPAPSDTPSTPPTTWVGDPITVSQAIDHRDNHLDDTELAIRGFVWTPTISIPCAPRPEDSPAYNQCADNFTWIATERPRGIDQEIRPDGPALRLLIRPDVYEGVELGGEPTDVIVMGHFDDHRAISCPAELIAQCSRNYIVDALLDPVRPGVDLNVVEAFRPSSPGQATIATAEEVEKQIIGIERSNGVPLVIAVFPVAGSAVAAFEPQATEAPEVASADAVWVLRYLETVEDERPIIRTRLIIDGRAADLPGSIYVPTKAGLMREITIID